VLVARFWLLVESDKFNRANGNTKLISLNKFKPGHITGTTQQLATSN
jgi:hypothetical protein